jgi:hypothetical protein
MREETVMVFLELNVATIFCAMIAFSDLRLICLEYRLPALHLKIFVNKSVNFVIDSPQTKWFFGYANMFFRYQNRMFKICECERI